MGNVDSTWRLRKNWILWGVGEGRESFCLLAPSTIALESPIHMQVCFPVVFPF